jgi:predicted phosphodiesterase
VDGDPVGYGLREGRYDPMKYALVSDIHANLQAWNVVMADMVAHGAEEVICLGDVVGYGPRPAECLASVYSNVHHFLLGNHDAVVAGTFDASRFNADAQRMIEWTQGQLDSKAKEFFRGLPLVLEIQAGDAAPLCVHGAAHQPEDFPYILKESDARKTWAASGTPLVFVGHTHRPCVDVLHPDGRYERLPAQDFVPEEGKRYIVNVGSVGMPRDRDFRACYCTYDTETGEVAYHRTAYDVEAFKTDVRQRIGETRQAGAVLAAFERKQSSPLRDELDFTPKATGAKAGAAGGQTPKAAAIAVPGRGRRKGRSGAHRASFAGKAKEAPAPLPAWLILVVLLLAPALAGGLAYRFVGRRGDAESPAPRQASSARPGGLEAHYTFDAGGGASRTGRLHARITGGRLIEGAAGAGLEFDGKGGIAVPRVAAGRSSFTCGMWIRTGPAPAGDRELFCSETSETGDIRFVLAGPSQKLQLVVRGNEPVSGTGTHAFAEDKPGTWRHVAVMYSAVTQSVMFFIDGKPAWTGVFNKAVPVNLGPARIAGPQAGVDDVRIYTGTVPRAAITSMARRP